MDVLSLALGRGFVAVLDAECWERRFVYHSRNHGSAEYRPCDLKWHAMKNRNHWYAATSGGHVAELALHRLLVEAPVRLLADHIDRDTMNNRMSNLRVATHAQNALNSRRYKHSKSPYRGITFRAKRNQWQAQIHFGGKNGSVKTLGYFATAEEAARAFDAAAYEMFGEFANLNFPHELKIGLPLFDLCRQSTGATA